MIRTVRTLLSGLATLLLSFFLAIIIWVTATQANDPVIIKPLQVPLTITSPIDTILVKPTNTNSNVTITVEGRASVLDEITRDDFSASVDLSQVPIGEETAVVVTVQSTDARATISSQDPIQLAVQLERLKSADIPVVVDIRGSSARGHSVGAETTNPMTITVTGKESVVDSLDFAQVTVFLNDDRETIIETRAPILYNLQGQVVSASSLELSTREVEVTIPVTEAADFAEKIITIDLKGQPASGYRVLNVTVEPSSILLQGRPTQLNLLSQVKTETIDITGLTETFVTPVSLALPDGVEPDEFTEIIVSVEIEPFQSTQTFNRLVEVQGLADGLEAQINPEAVRIVLFGPSPILDELSEDEVVVTVDLFGLDVGEYRGLIPDVSFPDRGIELRSFAPTIVTAVITNTLTVTEEVSTSGLITPISTLTPLQSEKEAATGSTHPPRTLSKSPQAINKPRDIL